MRVGRSLMVMAAGFVLLTGGLPVVSGAESSPSATVASGVPSSDGGVILDTTSFWRFRTVMETPELRLPDGRVEHARVIVKSWVRKAPRDVAAQPENVTVQKLPTVRLPSETEADWMSVDFDDSTWARLRGPIFQDSTNEQWKLILMRGRFEVSDPGRAGALRLSLAFRGGAVVYLNGQEIARSSLPAGPLDLYALAEPYPDDVYFTDEGYIFPRKDRSPAESARVERRIRRLTDVPLPPHLLRKGVNVLAVALHRSATPSTFYTRFYRGGTWGHLAHEPAAFWTEVALLEVRLTTTPGAAVLPNVARLAGRGFHAWNQSVIQKVFVADYPDPFSPLEPLRLSAVRNATFAGEVVVGDDAPIKGLTAVASDLAGPGTIPASAVQVRYALCDGLVGEGYPPPDKEKWFDSLDETPPAESPVYPEHGGALVPIWIAVAVPPDATPGDYTGTVTLRAEGVQPISVPLVVRVIDWTLPPVDEFVTTLDVIQSPESVAMAYDVPLWSDAHFKLLDRTFSILGPMGAKTLYVTAIRRTHFGNEHAMLRWVRGEDGELTPDFSIVEKYLDTALKPIPHPRGVIFYCWEPPESQGHAGQRPWDKPVLISVVDPASGRMSPIVGPALGTPESKVFWKKATDGMLAVLRKRGLEEALLLGLIGDSRPTKVAMDDMACGLNGQDHWALHSHLFCDNWQGHDVRFVNALWGIGIEPRDPSVGYAFGWSNPLWLSYYPREMNTRSTLVEHRVKLETWMGARKGYTPFLAPGTGARGLGRLGGDFWKVAKDRRGRIVGTLAGRYPEAAWGQLNLNFCVSYLLGQGPKGALPTVRSEALRLGLQEVEARIYVERAWLDDEAKTLLGPDLMARIRTVLDERIRMCVDARGEGEPWFIGSGWNSRTEVLFSLAAEISKKLGRAPRPNLTPRAALDAPPAPKPK
jgi:hypothetical protein